MSELNALYELENEVTHVDPPIAVNYVKGDATKPLVDPNPKAMRFLVHCCNDIGAWGAGFVLALSRAWPETERAYKLWFEGLDTAYRVTGPAQLGEVQFVQVANNIIVCNLIGQRSCGYTGSIPPVRYDAIRMGMAKIRLAMYGMEKIGFNCTFHSPRFGSDLAGGDWNVIESIIVDIMGRTRIPSTVYDYAPVTGVCDLPQTGGDCG